MKFSVILGKTRQIFWLLKPSQSSLWKLSCLVTDQNNLLPRVFESLVFYRIWKRFSPRTVRVLRLGFCSPVFISRLSIYQFRIFRKLSWRWISEWSVRFCSLKRVETPETIPKLHILHAQVSRRMFYFFVIQFSWDSFLGKQFFPMPLSEFFR